MDGKMTKHKINVKEFEKTERDSVSLAEFENTLRGVMLHSARPKKKSENREPTRKEIKKRWKISR